MSAIGPGDFVECVDGSPPASGSWAAKAGAYVCAGKVYRVERVGAGHWSWKYGKGDCVVLDGPETKYPAAGRDDSTWPVQRFRPIYRPKATLIEQLKQPVKEPA